ncbi:helicase ARIP4 [Parasteatoda tepidariorum]|uniref:helicase ARIP4 n=1 Tax=Parasteatoda tepidariorum TaxID=114398 RepID=UPI00077FB8EE|nr:helicase ARIP4 [Parasteatoda tepidariorum]
MEVFPPDESQPNEVGSGPTASQLDHMKAWDDNLASLEIVLQAACDTKDVNLNIPESSNLLPTPSIDNLEENTIKSEAKRKWKEDSFDSEERDPTKLKRLNNMVLNTGEVSLELLGSSNDNCHDISNLLSIVKPEAEIKSEDHLFDLSENRSSETSNSLVKLDPKSEIKEESSNFNTEAALCKPDIFSNVNDICFSDNNCIETEFKVSVPDGIKSDNNFCDELNADIKSDFYSQNDLLSPDIKNDIPNQIIKSEIDTGCALSSVSQSLPVDSKCINECQIPKNDEEQSVEKTIPSNSEDCLEKKKDKKEESDKNSKKDDKKKKKFERCNIRDIKLEDELDAVTLSAQKEEQERIRRLQEAQMRALQERLQQIEVEKEALSQLFSQPPDNAPSLFDSASTTDSGSIDDVKEPLIKSESDVVLLESSDDDKKPELQTVIPAPIEENIIDISSSSSGNDSDSDDSDKKDDDIMVLSDEGEAEGDGTAEDPNNSGAHTNDCFNLPDEEGRVLINVGHPPEDPDIFLAPQIAKVIKPHQIGGIRFLYDNVVENLERYKSSSGFGCILAHSMGLGKTVQVVSFVDVFLRHTPATLVLCIVPINTIQNWKAEFDMWVPPTNSVDEAQVSSGEVRPRDYNVFTLNENFKTMAARTALIAEWRKQGGVLLMGYEMYRMLALRKMPKIPLKKSKRLKKQELAVEPETNEQIKKYMDEMYEHIVIPGPDLVICDEGHRIKNSLASTSMALKSIKTRRRVVLTGYPLQNNLLEYWCMVDFVRPNYLGSRAEFCNMFERPISNGQCIDSTPRDRQLMRFRSHVLHSLLVGFVQRRGHSVLRAVLPKKEEHVLLIRMTPIQRQLYKCFVKDLLYVQQATNPLKLFAVCCKIWNHPDILYKLLQEKRAQEDIDLDIDINVSSTSGVTGSIGVKKRGIIHFIQELQD